MGGGTGLGPFSAHSRMLEPTPGLAHGPPASGWAGVCQALQEKCHLHLPSLVDEALWGPCQSEVASRQLGLSLILFFKLFLNCGETYITYIYHLNCL